MAPKSVLITGCSAGGIGSALAEEFLSQGLFVFATARDLSRMAHLTGKNNLLLIELDVVKETDVEAAIEIVKNQGATQGRLDFLINNAGRNFFKPVLDMSVDEGLKLFDTNLWGPLRLIHAFTPLLIESKGTFVSITSISGYLNVPWMSLYAASKRSFEIVSETLRLELLPFGVKVLSVVTGAVKSQGQTYFSDFRLPPASRYSSIEATIASRAQGGDGVPRMDTQEYARAVVGQILNGATGKIWCGNNAESTEKARGLPAGVMDVPLMKGTGLDTMSGMSRDKV